MSLRSLAERLELPRPVALWVLACATLLAFGLATRALYYALPEIPEPIDTVLGVILVYQAMLFLGTWIGVSIVLELWVAALVLGLLLARRHLVARTAAGSRLHALLLALLWTAFLAGHAAFDANPVLAAPCLASLPLLSTRARSAIGAGRAARAALALAGTLAFAWVYARDGGWSVLALAIFGAGLALLLRGRLLGRDRLGLALVLLVLVQAFAAIAPSLLPTHGGTLLVRDMAYGFCESEPHGRLYAALTRCSTLPRLTTGREACRRGAVAELDLHDLSLRRELRFFDADWYGRVEQLVCLDDTVAVGLNGMLREGRETRDGALVFEIDHPERFERDPVGPGQAHRIAWDRRRDALFFAPEWGQGIRRLARADGGVRWVRVGEAEHPPLPLEGGVRDSFEFGPESIHEGRDTIFFGEWIAGSAVREVDLDTLRLVRSHPHRNGGTVGVSVDAENDRLYVVGLWGLTVRDLERGNVLAKTRVGLLSRAPAIDTERGVVYVSSTVSGRIHVFDRETLAPRGTIPIGFGVRLLHLSQATGRLLASSWRAAWSFPAESIAR